MPLNENLPHPVKNVATVKFCIRLTLGLCRVCSTDSCSSPPPCRRCSLADVSGLIFTSSGCFFFSLSPSRCWVVCRSQACQLCLPASLKLQASGLIDAPPPPPPLSSSRLHSPSTGFLPYRQLVYLDAPGSGSFDAFFS